MTLTEVIYDELKNGLWTGVDYDGLRSKYEKSKGPFYNALQMVLADASAEVAKLSSRTSGHLGRRPMRKRLISRVWLSSKRKS